MTAPDPAWVEAGAKALTAGKSYGGWMRDEDAWKAGTLTAEAITAGITGIVVGIGLILGKDADVTGA